MSYTEIFNGEYDHEPLFKINANVWLAEWNTSTRTYGARFVTVVSISISPDEAVYYHVLTEEECTPSIECYPEDLFADKETAKDYAYQKLLGELDSELCQLKTAMDQKHTEYAEAQRIYHELEFFLLGFRKTEAAKQLPDI